MSAPVNSFYFIGQWQQLTAGTIFYKIPFLLAGIGTLVAALLACRLDGNFTKTVTLWGNNRSKNIVIALVPLLVVSLVGMPNNLHMNEHLYAFLIASVVLLYAFTEEIFWRGYVINFLSPLGWFKNYLVLGILWWAWHFNFTVYGYTWFLLLIVLSSFLVGKFVEGTKSYLTAAGLHSLIVILTIGGNSQALLYASVAVVLLWILISRVWAVAAK